MPSSAVKCWLTSLSFLPDHLIHSEGGHPARHRIHRRESELQARERCPDAGLLRGGEHFFPKVKNSGETKEINELFLFLSLIFFQESFHLSLDQS